MGDFQRKINSRLRCWESQNNSGFLRKDWKIPVLREKNYLVEDYDLDGDAPKQFIRVYFYKKGGVIRRDRPSTWIPYIAKTGSKWYPHESVIEYLINRIGQNLGLQMNSVKLFWINSQIRFLSRFFLLEDEELIHGAEICGDYLQDHKLAKEIADDRKTARELFTFEFIEEAIKSVFPTQSEFLLEGLVQILTFDAIVGNNDRHFYNWAVIRTVKKTAHKPVLAPVYDSSRGLFWNFSEQNIKKHHKNLNNPSFNKLRNYIEGAGPRICIEGDDALNHFELMSYLISYKKAYAKRIESLSSLACQKKVHKLLDAEFRDLFSIERFELIKWVLDSRFKRIRQIVNKNHHA